MPTSKKLVYDCNVHSELTSATQIQTSTGTWNVEYNGENRPIRWTNAATGTVITMTFDSQGRRTEYKSVTNGTQNTWLRFLYDGYLCIQVLYSNSPYNTFKEFIWDPTEPVATRPLVFRYAPNSLNLFYAFDGNKNVSDVFYRLTANGIGAHYDYAPFGATTRTHRDSSASFDIVSLNPFRFSSEYYDDELGLVYYNYRHYSPALGRFLSRDPIAEQGGLNLYAFVKNRPNVFFDRRGQSALGEKWSIPILPLLPLMPIHVPCLDPEGDMTLLFNMRFPKMISHYIQFYTDRINSMLKRASQEGATMNDILPVVEIYPHQYGDFGDWEHFDLLEGFALGSFTFSVSNLRVTIQNIAECMYSFSWTAVMQLKDVAGATSEDPVGDFIHDLCPPRLVVRGKWNLSGAVERCIKE